MSPTWCSSSGSHKKLKFLSYQKLEVPNMPPKEVREFLVISDEL